MFRSLWWKVGTMWCKVTHKTFMWPAHGHFQCRTCGRRYPAFAEAQMANQATRAAWKYAN